MFKKKKEKEEAAASRQRLKNRPALMSQWPKKEERGERKAGFKVSFISSSTDVTRWQSHSHEDNKATAAI